MCTCVPAPSVADMHLHLRSRAQCQVQLQRCRLHASGSLAHAFRSPSHSQLKRSWCRRPGIATDKRSSMAASAAAESTTDSAAYKDRVRNLWQQRSAAYDQRGSGSGNSLHAPMCERLVALAGVPPGAHVLDLCCGTGTVAFLAASAAGPEGRVVGVDISEGMVLQVLHPRPSAPPSCFWCMLLPAVRAPSVRRL